MSVTLMSFNIEHCFNENTQQIDFDAYADEIRRYDADIIGLNEVRDEGESEEYEAQAKVLAEKLGYYYYFAKATYIEGVNPYGNAILSRFPIISAETILVPDPEEPAYAGYYETRCLLKAKIDVFGGMEVFVIHWGLNPDEQANAFNTIVENVGDKRCVLMGDFNITPDDPLLIPINERLFDTAKVFEEERLSFPSDKPVIKIDYIFTSHDIKVLKADIPADVLSDHRPYIAIISMKTHGDNVV